MISWLLFTSVQYLCSHPVLNPTHLVSPTYKSENSTWINKLLSVERYLEDTENKYGMTEETYTKQTVIIFISDEV